ncbi:chromosome partitioning protein ParB [Acinetobacter baumannii]|nr:chromosome partitioning protein ParB [Acinetobacter baumannii]EKV7389808.1 chromosome partitioning protein ParB [Acinetobacter baumannii]EKW3202862.1 chromosome partitioning protein ParB [Acinetobacter baumannii]EKX0107440.1 chromosome partitioning protein ParB [Acinetobacter baumannii]ELB5354640.1 chromosome partitioning protein ParB [Acinetobacter baumannii]
MNQTTLSPSTTQIKKMTGWKKEPTVAELHWDFQQAKSAQQAHMSRVAEWLDNLNIEGSAKVQHKNKNRSTIVPKLIRKSAEWRIPALTEPFLSTSNLFQVDPMTWADKKAALQNALILNYQFQNLIDKVAFFDEVIRAVVEEGTAIVRVGWDFEEREVLEDETVYRFVPDFGLLDQLRQLIPEYQANPTLFKDTHPEAVTKSVEATLQMQAPMRALPSGTRKVKKLRVVRNQPTVEVCNLNNVYIDPTCNGNLDKAQFIIHSFETTYAELKRDSRYKNLEQLVLDSARNDPDHTYEDDSQAMQFSDKARKKIVVHEYWGYWDCDDNGTLHSIVASWVGNTLIRLEKNPFPDGKLPFVSMTYLPKRKSVYGEPDAELLLENQKILGAVTRGVIDLMGRSANGQTGMQKGMLDATNRVKYERGDDYEFNPNADPRQGIFMHTYPEIPQSAQFMIQAMNMEAESLTGVKSFSGSGGITGSSLGDTAIGVRSAMDAASKREMSILRRISAGVVRLGRKIISMNAEFLDEEQVIRITDEEFVAIKRDDLAGNFDLKLTISTAEGDEAKAQQIAFMMQTIGNNMDPGLRNQMLAEIFRLRKMPEFAKQIENYQPQPDPMQQQLQMLEMEKLKAEIELLRAQTQEALSEGSLKQAKIPVESARANSLQGDADKKSLDFVEQQDGTQHQRQMDLQAAKNAATLASQAMQHQFDSQENEKSRIADIAKAKLQHNSNLLTTHAQASLAANTRSRENSNS